MDIQEILKVAVGEFVKAYEIKGDPDLLFRLVEEETEEVEDAFDALVKELCDFMYVVYQAEIFQIARDSTVQERMRVEKVLKILGAVENLIGSERLNQAILAVHQSNMSKLDDNGKPIRREDGKILKGPNYQPPDLRVILEML